MLDQLPFSTVRSALDGHTDALRALLGHLSPLLTARAKRFLAKSRQNRDSNEVADLVQDGYLALFKEDARALRAWRPGAGLSLRNWAGLVCERAWRDQRRRALSAREVEVATDPYQLELAGMPCSVAFAGDLELWTRSLAQLMQKMSETQQSLFFDLFVEGRTVSSLATLYGVCTKTLYAERAHLMTLLAETLERELGGDAA